MTDFTRPNGGVDFSTYEVLSSADMNEMAANQSLAWEAETLRMTAYEISGEALLGAGESANLGPLTYDARSGCYLGMSIPPSSGGNMILVSARNGSLKTSVFGTAPTSMALTPAKRPYLINFPTVSVLVYADSVGANRTGVASSLTLNTWTELYAAATALQFDQGGDLGHRLAAPACFSSGNPKALIPGIYDGAGGFIFLDNTSGTTVTAAVHTSALLTTAINSVAVKSDSSLVIGVCQSDQSLQYDGTFNVVEIVVSTDADQTTQLIAWDERLSRWVLAMHGASGSYVDYLHWQTSTDGATWPTNTRRRLYLGPFVLHDFMITSNGLWVALIDASSGYYQQNTLCLVWSNDGGANWHKQSIGLSENAGSGSITGKAKFASGGDSVVALAMKTDKNYYNDTVFVGGMASSGTALLSEVV